MKFSVASSLRKTHRHNLRSLPLSLNTTQSTVLPSRVLNHAVDLCFIFLKCRLQLYLAVLDNAQLPFDLRTVTLSLKTTTIQSADVTGILDKLPVPCANLRGNVLECLLM